MGTYIANKEQLAETVRAYNDPFYFISRMKVQHMRRGTVPFLLYQFQKRVLYDVIRNEYVITLKPRQMGITTLLCAYALWLISYRPNQKVIIISLKEDVAKAFIRKMRRMWLSLPEHLRAAVANGTNKETSFGTLGHVIMTNGSEVLALPATEEAGRSESVSLLIMDEVAQQRKASVIWGASQQSLATGGKGVLISTAMGVGNFFHKYWTEAIQPGEFGVGRNGFFPILLNWRMHPERDINWYNTTRKLLGSKRMAQEVDCDFLQSGYTVFDTSKIRAIEERLNELPPCETHENGCLLVYHLPEHGKTYVIGADVSSGRMRDFSTFSIMDTDGVECACFKGHLAIGAFTKLLIEWGYRYNGAWMAPEINGIGEGVIAMLQDANYPNLFYAVDKILKLGEHRRDQSLVAGWLTTGKTRHHIITGLDEDLEDDLIEINNPFFVAEAYTFIYDENNRAIALGKNLKKGIHSDMGDEDSDDSYTDDAIFAVCIANEVRKEVAIAAPAVGFYGGSGSGAVPFSGGR